MGKIYLIDSLGVRALRVCGVWLIGVIESCLSIPEKLLKFPAIFFALVSWPWDHLSVWIHGHIAFQLLSLFAFVYRILRTKPSTMLQFSSLAIMILVRFPMLMLFPNVISRAYRSLANSVHQNTECLASSAWFMQLEKWPNCALLILKR